MRGSKLQKTQKVPSTKSTLPNTPNIKFSYHNYMNLTNEQYLLHALKLLGITQAQYLKQTKLSMNDQFFSKSQSASTTKQFFFIVFSCLKFMCSEEQYATIKMWYPPRTVNQQLQFKKSIFNIFSKLEIKNKVPTKLLISKNLLMGETATPKIIQFLRILSELSLRQEYLRRFSKHQRLIQFCFNETQNAQKEPNDINRFYVYPFTPSETVSNIPMDQLEISSLKKVYRTHIQIYRKKILSLSGKYPKQQQISCRQLMSNLVQQRQLAQKLDKKIPKSVLSDNRAFDRRKLIDKSKYVWDKLNQIQCHHIDRSQIQPILKLQGEIDKILLKWQTPSGINKMHDICKITQKLAGLKEECSKKTKQFSQFRQKINSELKKYYK